MSTYTDQTGKPINKDDRIHYASKGKINIGWVKELLPDNGGVRVLGKDRKRDSILKDVGEKVIVVVKGYYKERVKTQERNKV